MDTRPPGAPVTRYSFRWCYVRYLVLFLSVHPWLRASIALVVSVSLISVVEVGPWSVGLATALAFWLGFTGYFCLRCQVAPQANEDEASLGDCALTSTGVLTLVLCLGHLYVRASFGYDARSTLFAFSRVSLGLMTLALVLWIAQLRWPYVGQRLLLSITAFARYAAVGLSALASVWRGRRGDL